MKYVPFSERTTVSVDHSDDNVSQRNIYTIVLIIFQGRNDMAIFTITRELGILTWDEAFLSLRCTLLPDAIRAKYCELIIGTSNCSFLDAFAASPDVPNASFSLYNCNR